MKYLLLLSAFFLLTNFTEAVENLQGQIKYKAPTQSKLKKVISDFGFGYSMVHLGPSLGSGYEKNATFNRFNSGVEDNGSAMDPTGSIQNYHAFKLSYRATNDIALYYGYTYQDDLYKVDYTSEWDDGSKHTYQRNNGTSFNNQRIGMWINNIAQTSLFFFNMGLYYEMPTTKSSIDKNMQYGIGIQPNINFKTNNPKMSYGFNLSLQRDYYRHNNWRTTDTGSYISDIDGKKYYYTYTTDHKVRTRTMSISPYYNYSIADKLMLRTSLAFDWDQQGEQTDTLKTGKNMVDVGNIGLGYTISRNINVGTNLTFALEEPSIDRTAVSFLMNISI